MLIETKISFITILKNGIIHVRTKPNVVAEVNDLDDNLSVYNKYLKGEKGLFLIEFTPKGVSSNEAKKKFREPNRRSIKKVEAILVKTNPHRIEVNHYIKFHKPEHPVEIFEEKKEP